MWTKAIALVKEFDIVQDAIEFAIGVRRTKEIVDRISQLIDVK